MGNWFELGTTEMKADVENFEVFNSLLSRDKYHIFFKAYTVGNTTIDLATFETTNKVYMKDIGVDKNHVNSFSKLVKNEKYQNTKIQIPLEVSGPNSNLPAGGDGVRLSFFSSFHSLGEGTHSYPDNFQKSLPGNNDLKTISECLSLHKYRLLYFVHVL